MKDKHGLYKIFNQRVVLFSFAIIFLLATMGSGTLSHTKAAAEEAKASASFRPSISVAPTVAEYKSGVQVLISGSGFEPKQKLRLFINMGGIPSGIHFMVKPEPVPNDFGAFASVWKPRRAISKKLIKPFPVTYTLTVEDKDGKILCTVPLLFCDPKEKDKFPCTLIK